MPPRVKWTNRKKFKGKIDKLPKAVGLAVRVAMEEMAEEMVAAMKRLVPVDTGKLRDSIGWCWGAPPRDAKVVDTIKGPKGKDGGIDNNRITIFAGNAEAYYARWIEFGTVSRPEHPFFWPTWRAQKKSLRSKMNRHINAAIKQIAKGA